MAVAEAHNVLGLALLSTDSADDSARARAEELLLKVEATRQASALWRQVATADRLLGQDDRALLALERALDMVGVAEQRVVAPTGTSAKSRNPRHQVNH